MDASGTAGKRISLSSSLICFTGPPTIPVTVYTSRPKVEVREGAGKMVTPSIIYPSGS